MLICGEKVDNRFLIFPLHVQFFLQKCHSRREFEKIDFEPNNLLVFSLSLSMWDQELVHFSSKGFYLMYPKLGDRFFFFRYLTIWNLMHVM